MLCFEGFFIPGFPKLKRFQEHHDRVLKRFLPKIKKHLVFSIFSLQCILVTFYKSETTITVFNTSVLSIAEMCRFIVIIYCVTNISSVEW